MNLTEAQFAAKTLLDGDVCVDAGAGSGKTFVLVERIVHILETGAAELEEIVAITFTDLAASELKARLRKAFKKKAEDPEVRADPDSQSKWRSLERRAETARVSTIHSFCGSLVRENALRCGLDPDFEVLTEAESTLLREDVIRGTVHALLEEQHPPLLLLAEEHRLTDIEAALDTLLAKQGLMRGMGDRIPLADAGALADWWSSRTGGLLEERTRLLGRSRKARRVLRQLRGYLSHSVDGEDTRVRFCLKLAEILETAATGSPDTASSLIAELDAFKGARWNKKAWSGIDLDSVKKEVDKIASFVREMGTFEIDPGLESTAAALTSAFYHVYVWVDAAYREAKARRNAQDFEDLILGAVALLEDSQSGVLARARRGIRFLLMDEFQDTDSVQYNIARLLTEGDGPSLFLVGDAKQSIYGWRGAEVGVFHNAQRNIERPPIRLDINFRSVPNVLHFANDFFSGSNLLAAVESPYGPMRWSRDAWPDPRVEFLLADEEEISGAGEARSIEALFLAQRIAAMCGADAPLLVHDEITKESRPARYGDVAILLRSTSSLYIYERALQEAGIPYTVETGPAFYRRQEVLDIRNLLACVVDPWNEMTLTGYLRGPYAAISDNTLVRLSRNGGVANAFWSGHFDDTGGDAVRLAQARELLRTLQAHTQLPLPVFIRFALERSGAEAVCLTQFLGAQKAANVRKLAGIAEGFVQNRPPRLSEFVRYLDAMVDREVREGEAAMDRKESGAVTIMTIHKSKGLEYPIVALADTARGLGEGGRNASIVVADRDLGLCVAPIDDTGKRTKPFVLEMIRVREGARSEAEDSRLLYVAMTRARDHLLVSGSPRMARVDDSWLGEFDAAYGVFDFADGHVLELPYSGGACGVRIARTSRIATPRAVSVEPALDLNAESLARRANPPRSLPAEAANVSVTFLARELAGGQEADDSDVPEDRTRDRNANDAIVRGNVFHETAAAWDFTGPYEAVLDEALWRCCAHPGRRNALRPDIVNALDRLRQSEWGQRISADSRSMREAPFLWRLNGSIIEGFIDLILSDGAIVDYKTGKYDADKHRQYTYQVQLYAAAVREVHGMEPTTGCLLYVDADRAEIVDVSPGILDEVTALASALLVRLATEVHT